MVPIARASTSKDNGEISLGSPKIVTSTHSFKKTDKLTSVVNHTGLSSPRSSPPLHKKTTFSALSFTMASDELPRGSYSHTQLSSQHRSKNSSTYTVPSK